MTPSGVLMRGTCITLFENDDEKHVSVGHEHDEYFVVVEGQLRIILNESDEYIMNAGDSIYVRGRTSHSFQRIGQGQTILYVTTAMV